MAGRAQLCLALRVRLATVAVALGAACSLACSRGEPPGDAALLFDRGWSDGRDEWTKDYAHRFMLVHDRDGQPSVPGDGKAFLIRNRAGDRLTRYGYFEKKRDGEVLVVRQQDDARFTVRYRVYDCTHGNFDLCADVDGLPEGPKTYFGFKKKTLGPADESAFPPPTPRAGARSRGRGAP